MPTITELYAFVVEEAPGEEGIMGFLGADNNWVPLIGSNMKRVKDLKQIAAQISEASNLPYKILHFKLEGEIKK